jgi:hypothetical protein
VADYSEFPTTPTRWQENFLPEPEASLPPASPPPPARQPVDAVALVMGLLFGGLAIVLMTGIDVPTDWFRHGVGWVLLIGAGIALLVNELRKSRRRR